MSDEANTSHLTGWGGFHMARRTDEAKKDEPIAGLGPGYRIIGASRLSLDLRNYRIGIQPDVRQALKAMIARFPEELVELGKDMVEKGPDPSLLMIVMPDPDAPGNYIVLEGNRRLSVLRLFESPGRATEVNPSVAAAFKKLKPEFDKNPICSMLCYVVKDRIEGRPWVDLRHLGKQKGRGLMNWGSTEKARRQQDHEGKVVSHVAVLDFMRAKRRLLDINDDELTGNASTLDRVLNSKAFRSVSGIKIGKDWTVTITNGPDDFVEDVIEEIYLDFVRRGRSVTEVYTKEQRRQYIGEVLDRLRAAGRLGAGSGMDDDTVSSDPGIRDGVGQSADDNAASPGGEPSPGGDAQVNDPHAASEDGTGSSDADAASIDGNQPSTADANGTDGAQPSPSDVGAADVDAGAGDADAANAEKGEGQAVSGEPASPSKQRPKKDSLKRETLAPRDNTRTLVIPDQWVNRMYLALRELQVESQPVIGSVMMRVFLEALTELYLESTPLPVANGKEKWSDSGISLNRKVKSALHCLDPQGSNPDLYTARQGEQDDTHIHSIYNLHKFVHNSKVKANAGELKEIWDRWEPFMAAMCRTLRAS